MIICYLQCVMLATLINKNMQSYVFTEFRCVDYGFVEFEFAGSMAELD